MDFNFWDVFYSFFNYYAPSDTFAWFLYLAIFGVACLFILLCLFILIGSSIVNLGLLWETRLWRIFFRMQYKIISFYSLYLLFFYFFAIASFIYLYNKISAIESGAIDDIRHIAFAFLFIGSAIAFLVSVRIRFLRFEADNVFQNRTIKRAENQLSISFGKSDPAIQARINALYELKEAAKHSIDHNIKVMKILCAYIRTNCPNYNVDITEPLGEDIHLAKSIIIWRIKDYHQHNPLIEKEQILGYCIDLRQCDLHGLGFQSDIRNINFNGANLINAGFKCARLDNVKLDGADMNGANMKTAYAEEGDFSKCKNLTQDQIDVMYCGVDVIIPDNLNRPEHWPTRKMPYDEFIKIRNEWAIKAYPKGV